MKEIVFATNNQHKIEELSLVLEGKFKVIGLKEIGCLEDIPETASTLEGNAQIKAKYIFEKYGKTCFADDTGLEVKALNQEPGVRSARYAGEHCSFEENTKKLLDQMKDQTDRTARFRTVICLLEPNKKELFFEGECQGHILHAPTGDKGFGYDPVFRPEGFQESFAEMDMLLKNQISHRGKASQKLIQYLLHDII